ncbi:GNAT family N-acetyltransferase [Micromonospora sp. NPDC000089]|uniref:GNAT family N-acetyltransferase n=1 Tax=unclassified Micromonospora TaxID=2617518 RepID=UPI00369152B5
MTPAHPLLDRVAALFDDYRVHYGLPTSPARTRTWLGDQLAQHRLTAAAAVRADEVCGFVTVVVMPASLMLGTAWSIRDLYVAPRHRRAGVANALLRHTIEAARAAGALRVSLQTESDNHSALRLYAEVGFQPVTGLELLNLDPTPSETPARPASARQVVRPDPPPVSSNG